MYNPNKPEEVVVDYGVVRGGEKSKVDLPTSEHDVFSSNSIFDLQQEVAKASAKTINSVVGDSLSANAQVKALVELSEKGSYSLTLQIYSEHHDTPYEVVKQMKIPSKLITKLMPGSFVSCRVEMNDKNAVSLIFQDVSVD
jgi:hypothetical protein